MSFLGNEVMGVISTKDGNFNLGLDSRNGKHIFYNDKNLRQKLSFDCGTVSDKPANYDTAMLFEPSKSSISSNDVCVRLYFETEYDIYQTRGSVPSVENFVSAVFNQVATLYQNENIEVRISDIFVWTSPDPYTAADIEDLLDEFKNYRSSFLGDLGQLLTFRPEVGGGIAASFDGLCNPSVADRLSVSRIENDLVSVPVYSWTVEVITHEFGHLFGSRHTHACVWNGNNTAIDGCAGGTEGLCPVPGIPPEGGTIMSYCHLQSVGINFSLGFGPQPGNVIRNSVANADCLWPCMEITGASTVCTSDAYTLTNLPVGATVVWSVDPSSDINISGSGSTITATKIGNFSGTRTLIATVSTPYGSEEVRKEVYFGAKRVQSSAPYDIATQSFVSVVCIGRSYYFWALELSPPAEDGTTYRWTLVPPPGGDPFPMLYFGEQITLSFNMVGQYELHLLKRNSCGHVEANTVFFHVQECF